MRCWASVLGRAELHALVLWTHLSVTWSSNLHHPIITHQISSTLPLQLLLFFSFTLKHLLLGLHQALDHRCLYIDCCRYKFASKCCTKLPLG